MNTRLLFASLAALSVCSTGCPNDPTQSDELPPRTDDNRAANARRAQLDVTGSDWVYFSFENGPVTPQDPEDSLEWDIAFQRYNVRTNGGTSGRGDSGSADLGDLSLADTDVARVGGWVEDTSVEDARTGEKQSMNPVLSGWFEYDFATHQLSSKGRLYAVKSATGETALITLDDYYNDVGLVGHLTIQYRYPIETELGDDSGWVDPNACVEQDELADVIVEEDGVVFGETNVDARNGAAYFSFADAGIVSIDAPESSDAWDLSFDLWLLRSNSGTSGVGQGGAASAGTRDFDAAYEAPEDGWLLDTVQNIGAEQRLESTNSVFAGWFEYNPTTQRIRSFEDVYWIRSAKGLFAKLQIVSYYHPTTCEQGFFRLRWAYRPDGGRAF